MVRISHEEKRVNDTPTLEAKTPRPWFALFSCDSLDFCLIRVPSHYGWVLTGCWAGIILSHFLACSGVRALLTWGSVAARI